MSGWDFVEEIGVPTRTQAVPFIRQLPNVDDVRTFWDLPLEVVHFVVPDAPVVQDYTCPAVRYQDQRPKPTKRKARAPEEKESSDESDQDSEEDEQEEDTDGSVADFKEGEPHKWGADFLKCSVGMFAVIECAYPPTDTDPVSHKGITVVEVREHFSACLERVRCVCGVGSVGMWGRGVAPQSGV